MPNKDAFLDALAPVVDVVAGIDVGDPGAAAKLAAALPLDGAVLSRVRALLREGISAGWLCERENAGVRYGRVVKDARGLSVDAVHLGSAGAGHTHPAGELDLCFAVSGAPRFDGRAEGWTVYPRQSWHVPTVEGGVMDILYFLPGGAIRFEARPPDAVAVGLQAGTPPVA